ncbi:MAG: hypothetical protein GW778_01550 [Alphaproteobacteria bacterium]|nr:hypothetical protein [Alphaproteobacteria bacterium]
MGVEQTNLVDFISVSGDQCILTATSALEWGCNEHLYLIQEKLNTYLAFIESGEIYEHCQQTDIRTIVIKFEFLHAPDKEGEEFLAKCENILSEAGHNFFY